MIGGLAAGLRDLLHHLAQLLLAAGDEEDPRAGGGQRERKSPSQSRGRAGQERDFPVQRLVHSVRKCIIRPRMDTISHGIAGSVFARSFSERTGARAAFVLGAVAAMLPDLDFVFFSTRLDYLRDHRSWTHSFLVLPVFALGIALVGKLFWRTARLRTLWLFSAVGIATHILFDWITSFGTMFWTPVTRTRYSLDWVFILDPWFTGIVVASLVLSLVFREPAAPDRGRRRRPCSARTSPSARSMHARALAIWKRMDAPPAGATVAVLPQFLSPFRWLGLSESGRTKSTWRSSTSGRSRAVWPTRSRRRSGRRSSRACGTPIRRPAREDPELRAAPRLAGSRGGARPPGDRRLPGLRALPARDGATRLPDGGAEVVVQDLRFLPWFTGPWERGGEDGLRRQPFVYRVRFDAALRAIERGFVRSGRR